MDHRLEKQLRAIQRRIIGRNFRELGSFFPPALMSGLLLFLQLNTLLTLLVLIGGWWLTSLIAEMIERRLRPRAEDVLREIEGSALIHRFASGQTREQSLLDHVPLLLRPLVEFELLNCGNPKGLAREATLVALNLDWYSREAVMVARPHWLLQFLALPFALALMLLSHQLYPMSQFAFAVMTLLVSAAAYNFVSIPFAARQGVWTLVFFNALRDGLRTEEKEADEDDSPASAQADAGREPVEPQAITGDTGQNV